uniref:Uncharacterized protein n=1 Tax=Onchocerca volvulus TaxID=6282 RepID=A0A8R1U048_ONCVO
MEIMRNGYCTVKSFVSSVIEWRSAAAAPYLMFINSAFWWGVFYLDKETQLRLLVSCAKKLSSVFLIISRRFAISLQTTSVAMALTSAQFLYRTEFEKACWTAYGAVVLLLLNPIWLYYQVPQKINECVYTTWITMIYVAEITVISPLYSFYKILDYIVRLKWLIAILEKIKKDLLRIKTTTENIYVVTVGKLCAGKNAVLDVIYSAAFNIENFISQTIYEFRMGVKNGIIYGVTTIKNRILYTITATKNGIVYAVTSTRNGMISIIMSFKRGILSGSLALKNGIIIGILRLKNYLIMGFSNSRDAFYYTVITVKNYIRSALIAVQNLILNCFSIIVKWIKTEIVEPIQNAFRRVIQFLQYWLCAHWWPSLKSWFIQHVMSRLQLLFNYFCFGIVYVSCGYWVDPFVAFLSKHFKRFYAYFERSVLNPVKIWIRRQVDETLEYMKQMMHNLAIKVRDSILWPFFILLVSLMNKICVHLYRILLQPVVDVLYKKYKICEDYLLIYCLGPVCKFFVDHIPDRSPFCDDTDTELADLLPPGFSEEESDAEETSEKSSLPNRSLTPLTEDERDFVRGLEFPNLDTSDSSEAEFALKPKSKFRKSLRKKPKAHPKDPAPSVCNDELISTAYEVQNDKDKRKRSSSNSSHSGMTNESVFSSSIQNASDDADLQNLNALDSELEDHPRSESLADIVEIKKSKEISKDKKQNMDQKKIKEIEVFDTGQVSVNAAALTTDLDDSFEVLDK